MEVADNPDLKLEFRSFYPDYAEDELGNPVTRSSSLENPAYLYAVYYRDEILGMNTLMDGEQITVDDYTFTFHDPRPYTLIQVKKDPFTWLAGLGGLLVLVSLILAFYMNTEELWAVQNEDGSWSVSGKSRRAGMIFSEKLKDCMEKENKSCEK